MKLKMKLKGGVSMVTPRQKSLKNTKIKCDLQYYEIVVAFLCLKNEGGKDSL